MKSTNITALNSYPRPVPGARPDQFMTTSRYPLIYQPITKCGCTFVKSLLCYLEKGRLDPAWTHADFHEFLPRAGMMTLEEIKLAAHSFVVIRNPLDRFFSLYFDKILGRRRGRLQHLGRFFVEELQLIDPDPGRNIGRHQQNCLALIQWLDRNINGKTDHKVNWHWKPQSYRMTQVQPLNFTVFVLDSFEQYFTPFLEELVPDGADLMRRLRIQNQSKKMVDPSDCISIELLEYVYQVYETDMEVYTEVSGYWQGQGHEMSDEAVVRA